MSIWANFQNKIDLIWYWMFSFSGAQQIYRWRKTPPRTPPTPHPTPQRLPTPHQGTHQVRGPFRGRHRRPSQGLGVDANSPATGYWRKVYRIYRGLPGEPLPPRPPCQTRKSTNHIFIRNLLSLLLTF